MQVSVVVVVSVGKGKCRGCRWVQSRGSVLRVQMVAEQGVSVESADGCGVEGQC